MGFLIYFWDFKGTLGIFRVSFGNFMTALGALGFIIYVCHRLFVSVNSVFYYRSFDGFLWERFSGVLNS